MKTLHYTVEYRHPDTGYWMQHAKISPKYKITKTFRLRKFLWFTWDKTITQCSNQDEVEKDARIQALRIARTVHKKDYLDVRVRTCDHFKDYDWWTVVWTNGEFKDC